MTTSLHRRAICRAILPAGVRMLLSLVLVQMAAAAEPSAEAPLDPAKAPVAVVNGTAVPLRAIEDAMLKKEGVEKVEEWVHQQLEHVDWTKLNDADPVLSIGGIVLTRKQLAVALLKSGTGKVRDELISITMVEQALAKAGIPIDQKAIDSTYTAMERQFDHDLAAKGKERIDFASFLRAKEQQTPDEFKKQAGFRLLAGMRALVLKQAREQIVDTELKAWFDGHRASYDVPEAVRLSAIYIGYRTSKGPDGKERMDQDERDRLLAEVMLPLHRSLKNGQQSFEQTWFAYGKPYDREAGDGGALGWVTRDGIREKAGARPIPSALMQKALAVSEFPTLLEPFAGPTGVEIVRVEAHRPAKAADFAEVRERVFTDLVESQMEARSTRLLADLRRTSDVRYESLPEIIEKRSK
ncbi:MAG: peptidyl-prolyl cis-trans isomerase [Planctomycetes bacterium]|nr:peptidyl-prolyl cis-trans isomerase [Planctomycetota bacterium]